METQLITVQWNNIFAIPFKILFSFYKNRDLTEVVCDTTAYVTRVDAVVSPK